MNTTTNTIEREIRDIISAQREHILGIICKATTRPMTIEAERLAICNELNSAIASLVTAAPLWRRFGSAHRLLEMTQHIEGIASNVGAHATESNRDCLSFARARSIRRWAHPMIMEEHDA